MKYLVMRSDTLGGRSRSSGEYSPKIIEAGTPQAAVELALDNWPAEYRPINRSFIAVPMTEAKVVTLRPLNNYETEVSDFVG